MKIFFLVYRFKNDQGEYIFVTSNHLSEFKLEFQGKRDVLMTIPSHFFNEGFIYIDVMISNGRQSFILGKGRAMYVSCSRRTPFRVLDGEISRSIKT